MSLDNKFRVLLHVELTEMPTQESRTRIDTGIRQCARSSPWKPKASWHLDGAPHRVLPLPGGLDSNRSSRRASRLGRAFSCGTALPAHVASLRAPVTRGLWTRPRSSSPRCQPTPQPAREGWQGEVPHPKVNTLPQFPLGNTSKLVFLCHPDLLCFVQHDGCSVHSAVASAPKPLRTVLALLP